MKFIKGETSKRKQKWKRGLSITPFVTQKKDAGNVEEGNKFFNRATTINTTTEGGSEGEGMTEGLKENNVKLYAFMDCSYDYPLRYFKIECKKCNIELLKLIEDGFIQGNRRYLSIGTKKDYDKIERKYGVYPEYPSIDSLQEYGILDSAIKMLIESNKNKYLKLLKSSHFEDEDIKETINQDLINYYNLNDPGIDAETEKLINKYFNELILSTKKESFTEELEENKVEFKHLHEAEEIKKSLSEGNDSELKYSAVTREKRNSLGETMPLKDLLDLYWNSVRIDGDGYYKDIEGNYEDFKGNRIPEEILSKEVIVGDSYDYDDDDYPIVFAEWKEEGIDESLTEDLNNVTEVEDKAKEVMEPGFAQAVRSIRSHDKDRAELKKVRNAPKEGEETLPKDLKMNLDESLFTEKVEDGSLQDEVYFDLVSDLYNACYGVIKKYKRNYYIDNSDITNAFEEALYHMEDELN